MEIRFYIVESKFNYRIHKKYKNTKYFNWVAVSKTLPINIIQAEIESENEGTIKLNHDNTYTTIRTLLHTHAWNWRGLCENPTLNIEFVKKYATSQITPSEWAGITANPGIKMQDILDNQHLSFNLFYIAHNPNLTEDYLDIFVSMYHTQQKLFIGNIESLFDWENLSRHKNISMEYIYLHLDYPWCFDVDNPEQDGVVWSNPNLTVKFLEKWIKERCENNSNLISLMDWNYISSNPGIKMVDIETHNEYPWCWRSVFENSNLTYEFVNKNSDKLNWYNISINEFSGHNW